MREQEEKKFSEVDFLIRNLLDRTIISSKWNTFFKIRDKILVDILFRKISSDKQQHIKKFYLQRKQRKRRISFATERLWFTQSIGKIWSIVLVKKLISFCFNVRLYEIFFLREQEYSPHCATSCRSVVLFPDLSELRRNHAMTSN